MSLPTSYSFLSVSFFNSFLYGATLLCSFVLMISLFSGKQTTSFFVATHEANAATEKKSVSKLASLLQPASYRCFPPATLVPQPTALPAPSGSHCVKVPILMYHHVQPLDEAKKEGHASLTVDASIFATQMKSLQSKGYTSIHLQELSDFFDGKFSLPSKPIVLTFDDGYEDFFTYALPVLSSLGLKSDLFVATGLVENPGYLSWQQIQEAHNQNVSIDHHTWSHAKLDQKDAAFFVQELDTATAQLSEHGYDPVTIFAYPYGTHTERSITEVTQRGFTLAVTTLPGQMQCKENRFTLRRTRIGNSDLVKYGL